MNETVMSEQGELWAAIARVRDLLAETEDEGGSRVPVAMVYDALAGAS